MNCNLCGDSHIHPFQPQSLRTYYQCTHCELVFVSPSDQISPELEIQRYKLHDNTCRNKGYVEYLSKFADNLARIDKKKPTVLDFGSGAEGVLSVILKKRGIMCTSYDPLFDIGSNSLQHCYDVVIACEVIEHLRDLRGEISLIKKALKPYGAFLIRTGFYSADLDFNNWWYTKDSTHINFFSIKTINVLAEILEKKLSYSDGSNVAIIS